MSWIFASRLRKASSGRQLDKDGDGDVDGLDFAAGFIPNYGRVRDTSGYS